jgi:hypothetical protein
MSLTLVKIKLSHLWLSVSRGTDGNICFVSFLTTHASQGGLRYYNSHTSFYDDVHANKQKFATPLVENILAHLWLSVSRGTDGNIRFVFDDTLLREEMRHSDEWKRASFSFQKKERINSCC